MRGRGWRRGVLGRGCGSTAVAATMVVAGAAQLLFDLFSLLAFLERVSDLMKYLSTVPTTCTVHTCYVYAQYVSLLCAAPYLSSELFKRVWIDVGSRDPGHGVGSVDGVVVISRGVTHVIVAAGLKKITCTNCV